MPLSDREREIAEAVDELHNEAYWLRTVAATDVIHLEGSMLTTDNDKREDAELTAAMRDACLGIMRQRMQAAIARVRTLLTT